MVCPSQDRDNQLLWDHAPASLSTESQGDSDYLLLAKNIVCLNEDVLTEVKSAGISKRVSVAPGRFETMYDVLISA